MSHSVTDKSDFNDFYGCFGLICAILAVIVGLGSLINGWGVGFVLAIILGGASYYFSSTDNTARKEWKEKVEIFTTETTSFIKRDPDIQEDKGVLAWASSNNPDDIKEREEDPLIHDTRDTTTKEANQLLDALRLLVDKSEEELIVPQKWRIIDAPLEHAYVWGQDAVITRATLDSPQLPAVIAWLLWWINQGEGVRFIALRQCIQPFKEKSLYATDGAYYDFRPKPVDVISGGGHDFSDFRLKVRVMQPWIDSKPRNVTFETPNQAWSFLEESIKKRGDRFSLGWNYYKDNRQQWADYFKQCQFEADEFVAKLGLAPTLIELLSKYQDMDAREKEKQIKWHNPNNVRIDRLEQLRKAGSDI